MNENLSHDANRPPNYGALQMDTRPLHYVHSSRLGGMAVEVADPAHLPWADPWEGASQAGKPPAFDTSEHEVPQSSSSEHVTELARPADYQPRHRPGGKHTLAGQARRTPGAPADPYLHRARTEQW